MKVRSALALAAMGAVLSLPAAAQFAKPDDAVKYRQSALSVMGTHFGRLGAMANGKMPFDAKAAQESADIVVFMSKLPWAGFGAAFGYDYGEFFTDVAAAGLAPDLLLSTWDLRPFAEDSDFLVAVLRAE